MDGFKSLPKMQCFKEGGSVKSKPVAKCSGGKMKEGGKTDMAQDKSMVKKGVKQHETALHKGEPKTELKLKTGGRAKKATGTVKKFEKASGQYGAKKTAADKKNIKEAKAFKKGGKVKKCNEGGSLKPTDSEENPGLAKLPTNVRNKMGFAKKGGKVAKKMQAGGSADVKDPQALTDKIALEENTADANIIPNALKTVKRVGKQAIKTAKDMFGGQGSVSDAERQSINNIAKKKGGKVKKYAAGGAVFSDEEKQWLGGADSTDPFILARMRSALGDKKPAAAPSAPVRSTDTARLNDMARGQGVFAEGSDALPGAGLAAAPSAPVRSTDIARLNEMAQGQGVFPEGSAALPTSIAPVRRPPMRRPMAKPETSADLDPYGATRKETSADLDPYNAASKPGAIRKPGSTPYIDIPANNPGMKQFRTDAVSPMESAFNWLTKSRSQRNKPPVS